MLFFIISMYEGLRKAETSLFRPKGGEAGAHCLYKRLYGKKDRTYSPTFLMETKQDNIMRGKKFHWCLMCNIPKLPHSRCTTETSFFSSLMSIIVILKLSIDFLVSNLVK